MSVGELLPFWAMLACSALVYGAILWEVYPGRDARRAGHEATDQEPTPPPPVTGAPITLTDREAGAVWVLPEGLTNAQVAAVVRELRHAKSLARPATRAPSSPIPPIADDPAPATIQDTTRNRAEETNR